MNAFLPISMILGIATVLGAAAIGYRTGAAHVQSKWDAEKAVQAKAIITLIEAKDAENARLADLATKIRKEKQRDLQTADARYRAELERLRSRPEERAGGESGLPDTAAAGTGCTGAGLAGPDARFLAGFALDAARLQAAYDECKAKYEVLVPSTLTSSERK